MTDWDRMLVSIAIDAAKSCIHVFEAGYPADDRPRKALEATEKWLDDPTRENRQSLERLEIRLWRSKDWGSGEASLAAQACALAARAARHPLTSAMHAIECERCAHGIDHGDYSRQWLWKILDRYGSQMGKMNESRRAS
jgi:hypothetical protein